jgi:NYN domain
MIAPFVPTSTPIYRPRCTVYVDGFNFYFGIFENHPEWKWLNIERFFTDLRPLETVSVKYFTAIVDEDIAYSEAKFRQEKYLKALGTLPNLQIIKGKYQKKLVRCQAECAQEYSVPREKKTDVNIAVHMISDCLETTLDSLVLVSDDSDLEPAIAWIHKSTPSYPLRSTSLNCRRILTFGDTISIGALGLPVRFYRSNDCLLSNLQQQ